MKKSYLIFAIMTIALMGAKAVFPKSDAHDWQVMLFGTYTEGCDSEGLYVFHFNQETGQFIQKSSCKAEQPSFVRFTPDGKQAVSVCEFGTEKAAAEVFSFDKEQLTRLSTAAAAPHEGKGAEAPCNVWTNGRFAVTANYTGGSLSVFALQNNGHHLSLRQFIKFPPLPSKKVSHIHCALPTPEGKYLLVTDLGNDCIYRFTLNKAATPENDVDLLLDQRIVYNGPKGCGPRHFQFSEDGRMMYLINELGGTIVVFRYENGFLLPLQELLAEEIPAHGSADIHLSPDGKFLYASHRLQNDGISIYSVNQKTGLLKKVGYQRTARHPRNFAITPNGRFLLVASRDDNVIEVYRRNLKTGLLQKEPSSLPLPKPVCITILGWDK